MKLLLKISIITIFCILLSFAHSTFAQIPKEIDGVSIDTSIDSPKPGQNVEVYVESFNFDLNSSSIVWMVNGKVQNQGVGVTKTTVTAPKIGSKMTVSAAIKSPDGREIQKIVTIKTGYTDIVWESSGYTPPFFQGKLPFSYQNSVKLIAMPHLSADGVNEIDPKTLVYSWKRGGKYIENGQGYGKQSVVIAPDDLPKTLDITVDISNRDQTEHTSGTITLEPSEPNLSFYEEDSLYGVLFNKTLSGTVPLKNTEMKVLAIPYGFNLIGKDISYAWYINGLEQSNLFKNRSITIKTRGDTDGRSNINLEIRNLDDILQGAREEFEVYFSKKQNGEEESVF